MTRRLKVAWFSPLEGGSVSSYVTNILLDRIAHGVDLTLFHNGERRSIPTSSGEVAAEHYLNAVSIDQNEPFDLFFYQLEDRKECDFMRIHLALKPGVVWFHDFLLSNHGPEPILNSSWTEIVERFADPARDWPEHTREYTTAGVRADREVAMSFLALFSNPRDHEEYTRFVPKTLTVGDNRSMLLRHPVPEALFSLKVKKPEKDITIALCGLPRVETQVHQLFEALHRVEFPGNLLWPVPQSEVNRALELAAEFDLTERCRVYADDGAAGWERALHEVHLGVHLRFSAFGQPSPYLPMTLAAGIPAVVTDFASGALYPDNAVFKVSPGRNQVAEIAAIIGEISNPSLRTFTAGRDYAREFFHPEMVSQQLLHIFEREAPRLAQYSQRWRSIEWDAHRELVREARTLIGDEKNFIDGSVKQLFDPIFAELGWLKAEVV